MAQHASLDGTASETGRRVVLATVALVVAVALAVAFAPGVAAADTLERNGSNLVVNVSEVDDPEMVTVKVADSDITYSADAVNDTNENGEVLIDVRDGNGNLNGTDLRNANVTVTVELANGNTTDIVDGTSVPLHTVEMASDRPAWVGTEGENATSTLYVPLDAAGTIGVPNGETVDLDLDRNGTVDVTGTVRGDGTQLTIERGSLIDAAGDSRETLDFQVVSSGDPVSNELTVRAELRSTHDGLALWHPLFASEETYSVNASRDDAQYLETGIEPENGFLSLSDLPAGSADIRVLNDDDTVFVDRTLDNPEPFNATATVTDNGNLRFSRSLAGLTAEGAIVGSGEDSDYLDIGGSIDSEGQLTVENAELTGTETMLLSTTAGDVVVNIGSTAAGGGSGFGALSGIGGVLPIFAVFLIPLVVGAVVGALFGHRNQSDTDLVETGGVGLIGFGLAGIPLLVLSLFYSVNYFSPDPINIAAYIGILFGGIGAAAGHRVLSGGAGVAAASGPFAAKVTVTDGSDLFRGDVSVHYREPGGQDRYDPVTVRGGRDTIQLPGTGTWEVYARHGSSRSSVKTVDANNPSAELTIPVEASLTVVDATDGEPIADATISGDAGISHTTDRTGAITLDPPEDTTEVEVKVSHDRYATATERVTFRQNANHTVELDRRTGRLRGSVQVDGAPVGGVPLRIVPDDAFLSDRFEVENVTTDADGALDPRDVPIGQYRIEATLGTRDGAYEGTATTVSVTESGTARAEIDARFTWQLDDTHRTRIDRLRRDVRSLSEGGGRDGTIPRYYASVVESMLDAAESVPEAGHEFVDRKVDPGEAVDGILAAADRTTDAISEAMTTKRNVDLFAACADMPDPDVRWRGSFDLADLLDRLEADSGANRREVKQRYESVDGLIEDRRGDLSEIAPAREMQQRAWELTREADRGPEAIAIGYTSLLLLDAVEDLFEHDALRERLTRTVF